MKHSVRKALGNVLQGWRCCVPQTVDGYEGPEDMGEQLIGLPRQRTFQGEIREKCPWQRLLGVIKEFSIGQCSWTEQEEPLVRGREDRA